MNRLRRTLFADLKQVVWAIFLVYLVLLAIGFLFGRQIGYYESFLACLAVAILVAVTFIILYLLGVLCALLDRKRDTRLSRFKDHS